MQSERANRPHVVFYNLTCSGASAIVPILNEILKTDFGYEIWGHPETSHLFEKTLDLKQPRFHWTHSPVDTFKRFLNRDDFRFICLYRDPRDVLVSMIKDFKHHGHYTSCTEEEVHWAMISNELDKGYYSADQWLHLEQPNVMHFSFETMKADIPAAVNAALTHFGLHAEPGRIANVCKRYSFEAVTGRQPGEDGPIIRSKFMYRTGKSGNWKTEFTPIVKQAFYEKFGRLLERWGYVHDDCEIQPYRGYKICEFEGHVTAYSPILAQDFCIASTTTEALKQLDATGQFFTAGSLQALKEAVDQFIGELLSQVRQHAKAGQMTPVVDALKHAIALTGAKDSEIMQLAQKLMQTHGTA